METIRVSCSNAESRFGCASFRTLRLVLWLFTSCVWDVLRYRILKKTAFDFFGNVVSVVLYCVQLFWWFSHKPSEKYWPISPKAKHKISKKTLSTFQKIVSRTSSDLSTWNNTCFLFECRVKFRLRQTSKATFGTLALYILRLRCLVLSNTYKNSSFLEQNRNFPKRRWGRSKNVFLSSAGLVSLVVTIKSVLKTSSDLSAWNNACFFFKCRVTFGLRWLSEASFDNGF